MTISYLRALNRDVKCLSTGRGYFCEQSYQTCMRRNLYCFTLGFIKHTKHFTSVWFINPLVLEACLLNQVSVICQVTDQTRHGTNHTEKEIGIERHLRREARGMAWQITYLAYKHRAWVWIDSIYIKKPGTMAHSMYLQPQCLGNHAGVGEGTIERSLKPPTQANQSSWINQLQVKWETLCSKIRLRAMEATHYRSQAPTCAHMACTHPHACMHPHT